jgi:hypothetical protein
MLSASRSSLPEMDGVKAGQRQNLWPSASAERKGRPFVDTQLPNDFFPAVIQSRIGEVRRAGVENEAFVVTRAGTIGALTPANSQHWAAHNPWLACSRRWLESGNSSRVLSSPT